MKVQKKQNLYKSLIEFMPIILMIAIVPLIVRAKIVMLEENTAKFWINNYQIDVFSYTKTRAIMLLSVWMIVNAFFFFSKKDFKKLKENKWIFYPVIVFVFSLIASTILSEHKNIAIWGAPERYEGMIVHLCYIIMFLYTYMTLKTEEDFKYIKYSILFLASAMAFIGLMQAFGKDILTMDFMRNFIVPKEYREMLSTFTTETNKVYLTLQNSNYVGTYVELIMPFLLMFSISKYEHKYSRIYSGILAFITFFILVKSGSKAGLFAVMCILLLLPIIFYKAILNIKKTTIFITIAVILFTNLTINIFAKSTMQYSVYMIKKNITNLILNTEEKRFDPTYGLPIYDIKINENIAEIYTKTNLLNIHFDDKKNLSFYDKNSNLIKSYYSKSDNSYTFKDDFENIKIVEMTSPDSEDIVIGVFYDNNIVYRIRFSESNNLTLVDFRNNDWSIQKAPYIGFEGKERALTNRGYIWSRTFPLILDKPILGHGSDSFVSIFPQNDMPAKMYAYYGKVDIITDKPHSIYLLYAVNNGLIGLLSILALWFGCIVLTIKNGIFKSKYTKVELYKVAYILSVIGYMLTGMLNDSIPVTAPIFWVILGTGFALNKMAGKAYEG